MLFENNLQDHTRPKYKNYCENCGRLINIRRNNWLLFAAPPMCHWKRNEVLVCKTCFTFLAEEYFYEKEIPLNMSEGWEEHIDRPDENTDKTLGYIPT